MLLSLVMREINEKVNHEGVSFAQQFTLKQGRIKFLERGHKASSK